MPRDLPACGTAGWNHEVRPMPLVPVGDLLGAAMSGGYAVGYFESWNLESLQGTIDAAEQTRSPIIIGFNGDFLSDPARTAAERIAWYGALGRAAAESASVPCGLIFNECRCDDAVRQAIDAGFNIVMPVDADAPYDEYVGRVRELVARAHASGVAVEGEVGELPFGGSAAGVEGGALTDPDQAAKFVEATGVDVLAVSIGNVHVLRDGQRALDLDRLAALRERIAIPLDLHGGTGIGAESVRKAVAMGAAKVTYGTYIKERYLAAVRKALDNDAAGPHDLLGIGGADDVMVAGRIAVREAVLERIDLLSCRGRA